MTPGTEQVVAFLRQECQQCYRTLPGVAAPSSQSITKRVQHAATTRFNRLVAEYVISGSNLRVDLYDPAEKVPHELMLGDGSEIFKNIVKALVLGCDELVVYARPFPHASMSGYRYAANQLKAIHGKLPLAVTLINFMEDR